MAGICNNSLKMMSNGPLPAQNMGIQGLLQGHEIVAIAGEFNSPWDADPQNEEVFDSVFKGAIEKLLLGTLYFRGDHLYWSTPIYSLYRATVVGDHLEVAHCNDGKFFVYNHSPEAFVEIVNDQFEMCQIHGVKGKVPMPQN